MRTILFYLAVASTLCSKAQFAVTAIANPVAGDVESSVQTFTTGGIIMPISGTNKVWNYSSLSPDLSTVSSATYVPSSTIPNNNLFPGATIGTVYGPGYYTVLKINSTTRDYLGSAQSTPSNCIAFSNPQTSLKIPFAYGNNYVDTYGYSNANEVYSGTITALADGTGTLVLPGYTLTSVLKVSQQFNDIDLYTVGSTTYSFTNIGTQHLFYSAASKFPLLSIYTYTSTQNPGNMTSTFVGAAINSSFVNGVGIEEFSLESSFNIYPNPVKDNHVSVNFTTKDNAANINLLNTLGQVVKENVYSDLNAGENKINFDLKNISTGIYYLQLRTKEGEVTKKLIIE